MYKWYAICQKCDQMIMSPSHHEIVSCRCHAISIDGGNEYLRMVGERDDFKVFRSEDGMEIWVGLDLTEEEEKRIEALEHEYDCLDSAVEEAEKEIKDIQVRIGSCEDSQILIKDVIKKIEDDARIRKYGEK